MARELKVFTWLGHIPGGFEHKYPDMKHRVQVRCCVAASSKAEFLRITGMKRSVLPYVSITGNAKQIEVAMSKPGTVFFQDDLNHKIAEQVFLEHPQAGGWG